MERMCHLVYLISQATFLNSNFCLLVTKMAIVLPLPMYLSGCLSRSVLATNSHCRYGCPNLFMGILRGGIRVFFPGLKVAIDFRCSFSWRF